MRNAIGILEYIQANGYEEKIFGKLNELSANNSVRRTVGGDLRATLAVRRRVANCRSQRDENQTDRKQRQQMVRACQLLQPVYKQDTRIEKFIKAAIPIIINAFGLVASDPISRFAIDVAKIIYEYFTK